ncbi:MAG TPA: c-type cytochrome [Rubrivivax sp.]|nr:c-type cytochrome [Rubrivivax sp.]
MSQSQDKGHDARHDQSHQHAKADAHDPDDVHHVHEGPIRTPKQLIWTVLAAFVIPVVVIIMLVNFVDFDTKPAAGSDGLQAAAVAQRIKPVGTVDFRDVANPAAQRNGEQVYQGQCAACHTAGVANAPKLADVAAWGPRLQQGFEVLVNSALKGKGAMGPQGGGDYTDFEIARAVHFLANQGGAKFPEPQMPAAAGAAAGAASAPN